MGYLWYHSSRASLDFPGEQWENPKTRKALKVFYRSRCERKLGLNKLIRDPRKPSNTLPLVGNGILFLQPRQKLFSWFVKCERQTGYETLEISVPTLPPGVIISDPKNLDFVFKNEGLFNKGQFVKQRSWDLFGKDGDVFLVT